MIYYKTVGKHLQLNLKRKSVLISILLPLLSAVSVFLTHYVIRDDQTMEIGKTFILQIAPYYYLDTLTYMIGAYWYLSCECLSSTSIVLAEEFQKVFFSFIFMTSKRKFLFYYIHWDHKNLFSRHWRMLGRQEL